MEELSKATPRGERSARRGAGERLDALGDHLEERVEAAQEFLHDLIEEVKPRLRGWIHLATVPVVLIAGLVLTVLAPTVVSRSGAAVFTFTAVLLFGVSAVYHRGNGVWDRRTHLFLRRADHSNIYLLIGGSTTPFALTLLEHPERTLLLSLMWAGVTAGVVLKIFWVSMPRKLSTAFYIGLGWLPICFADSFAEGAQRLGIQGTLALTLIALGGVLYTIGGVIYGLKRPNPWPLTFGWHEAFHLFTVLACLAHFSAVALVIAALT